MKWTTCNNYSVLVGKNWISTFLLSGIDFLWLQLALLIFLFHSAYELLVLLSRGFCQALCFVYTNASDKLGCLRWANEVKRPWIIQCQYLDALGQNVTKIRQTIFSAKRKMRLCKETFNFLFDLKRLKSTSWWVPLSGIVR